MRRRNTWAPPPQVCDRSHHCLKTTRSGATCVTVPVTAICYYCDSTWRLKPVFPALEVWMNMESQIPTDWRGVLNAEFEQPYWRQLEQFVAAERREHSVYPPQEDVFNALELTPYEEVKVLLLGQDPYYRPGQAHGLCFSVRPGVAPPPSLVNMYKELEQDLGIAPAHHGYLESWARQGILMLNAVLTVRAGKANSHQGKGWERFTDAVIQAVSARSEPTVFVLWGNYAKKKVKLIDARHSTLTGTHPSPLSAHNGFFGSRPFSAINAALQAHGKTPIDWRLPPL
jgi:uracil-DNA glycosylase